MILSIFTHFSNFLSGGSRPWSPTESFSLVRATAPFLCSRQWSAASPAEETSPPCDDTGVLWDATVAATNGTRCQRQRTQASAAGASAQGGGCVGSSPCGHDLRREGNRTIDPPTLPRSARASVSGGYPRLAAIRTVRPEGRVPVRSQAPWLQASAWRVRRRDDRLSGRQTLRVSIEGIRAIRRGFGNLGTDRDPVLPDEPTLFQLAILIKSHSLHRPEWNCKVEAGAAALAGSLQAAFGNQAGEVSRLDRWRGRRDRHVVAGGQPTRKAFRSFPEHSQQPFLLVSVKETAQAVKWLGLVD